jgi:S-adenosylmethionine:tRNA ribosyltransferase-isomerase
LTAEFDYELPAGAVAQRPAARGSARLLDLATAAALEHRRIADLPTLLRPGDLMVVNDTRVIPARLYGDRAEILLAEKVAATEWLALVKPGRRARIGDRLRFSDELDAEVLALEGDGKRRLRFNRAVEPFLDALGHVPLPPYIDRPDDAADRERYQTVFAREAGAIAAPTAGLHFSQELLAHLGTAGIEVAAITLHVGLGTFKPVSAELVHEHRMDAERFLIPATTERAITATRERGGRIVAVGTTVVRTLEASALLSGGRVLAGHGKTDLFITPGFQFRVVDLLLTNFHLPRSTLLMLVCALAGRERVLNAYREAIAAGYRFYSYGDAMLAAHVPALAG